MNNITMIKQAILDNNNKLFQECISKEKDNGSIKNLIFDFFENRVENKSNWECCHKFISNLKDYKPGEQDFNSVKTISDLAVSKISNKEITKAVFLINSLVSQKKEKVITKACIEYMKQEEKNYSSFNIQTFIANACTILQDQKEDLKTMIFFNLSRNSKERTDDQNKEIQNRTYNLMKNIYLSSDETSNEKINIIIDSIEKGSHSIQLIKNDNLRNYFLECKSKKEDQKIITQALNTLKKTNLLELMQLIQSGQFKDQKDNFADEISKYVDGLALIYHYSKKFQKNLSNLLKDMLSQLKEEHINPSGHSKEIEEAQFLYVRNVLTGSNDLHIFNYFRCLCTQINNLNYGNDMDDGNAPNGIMDVASYIEVLYAVKPCVNDGLFKYISQLFHMAIMGVAEKRIKGGKKEVEKWLGKNPNGCPSTFHDGLMKEYNEKIKPKIKS